MLINLFENQNQSLVNNNNEKSNVTIGGNNMRTTTFETIGTTINTNDVITACIIQD